MEFEFIFNIFHGTGKVTFTKKKNGGKIKGTAGTGRADSLEILVKREKNWTDFSWDRTLQYKAGQCLQCGCCLDAIQARVNSHGRRKL